MDTMPDEETEDFLTVRVKGQLITKDDRRFDRMFGGNIEEAPIDKDEIVLPVFDLEFEGFDNMPKHSTRKMIQDEIDSTVMKNRDIAKMVDKVNPEDVSEVPPIGKPQTENIDVGHIAVTPSQEGMISKFYLEDLANTVDSRR